MADESQGRAMRGFVVGVVVAGMIAAGFFLSQSPSPAPAAAPAPSAPPAMMPPPIQAELPTPPAPATPREQADDLFNDAMMASERKDAAALAQVLPNALAAYRSLGNLDDDGRYHLALLELAGGDLKATRATLAELLARNPGHLLALGVGMRVEQQAGNVPGARDFAGRLLKAYDAEVSRPLTEYQDHQRMLPAYQAEAQALLRSN